METLGNKDIIIERLACYLLLLAPILQTYGWGRYNFALIATVLLAVYNCCIFGLQLKKFPKFFLFFLIFWYISHILAGGRILHFGIISNFFVFYLLFSRIKVTNFIPIYERIALICIIFLFIQELTSMFLGYRIPGVFQFLPLSLDTDKENFFLDIVEGERSSSFFSEPAHFAQFLLPLLAVEVFYFNRIRFKWVALICLALFILRSGNAIFGLFVISVYYLFNLLFTRKIPNRIPIFVASIIFLCSLVFIYIKTDAGSGLLERKESISMNSTENYGFASSGFIRIVRGYYVYKEYSPLKKLIGDDTQNYLESAISTSRVAAFFREGDTYLNGIQTLLCYTGIIGTFIFIILLSNLWRETNVCGKAVLLILILLFFISCFFFSYGMGTCMLLSNALRQSNGKNKSFGINIRIKTNMKSQVSKENNDVPKCLC